MWQKTISVIYPAVQRQVDGASCGLLALAFAHTICKGKNPSDNCKEFRSHFLSCLQKKEILSFPCKATQAIRDPVNMSSSVKFRIYCLCRLPDTGDKMICCSKCTEWYHFTCVQILKGRFYQMIGIALIVVNSILLAVCYNTTNSFDYVRLIVCKLFNNIVCYSRITSRDAVHKSDVAL